jgi:hypothetical protein
MCQESLTFLSHCEMSGIFFFFPDIFLTMCHNKKYYPDIYINVKIKTPRKTFFFVVWFCEQNVANKTNIIVPIFLLFIYIYQLGFMFLSIMSPIALCCVSVLKQESL